MDVAALMLAPDAWDDAAAQWQPVGFVQMSGLEGPMALPPFPLVGLGDAHDAINSSLDAFVEAPVSAEAIARNCVANPHAAASAVHLLRLSEGIAPADGLMAESQCYGLLQGSAEHLRWLATRAETPRRPAGTVRVERRSDVLEIVVDRPGARNAIDAAIRDGLSDALQIAIADPEIRTIRLRSTGAAFSIGGDLAEFGTTRDPATAHLVRARTLPAHRLAACADRLDVHVQGACIGAGLEMAAFAKRLTASPSAWFQLPELAMGLIPGAGGCVSLPRRIGRQRTALMLLSGRRIGAETALRWGLIDGIVDEPPVDPCHADEIG